MRIRYGASIVSIVALVFFASFAAIPTQAETTAFQFSKNLQLRDAGPDVRLLQQYLNAQGFLVAQSGPGSAGSETLTFGLRTYRALVSYQEVHNLPATGFFGPLTRATVTAISSAGSTPSNTSTNPSGSSQQSGSSNAQSLAPTSSQQTIPLSPPSVSLTFGGGGEGGGGGGSSNSVTSIPDTTPPVVTSISSGTPGQTSTTITWTTDENANSQVNYGTTSAYGATTTLNSALASSHSVVVSGLTATTTYHYRVRSSDASGNLSVSSDQTFTTASMPDTTPPSVSLTVPSTGSTVSGSSVTLTATAFDNVAVANVQFKVDTANIGPAITSSPYTTSWNSTGVSDGSHTLYAVAEDTSGNYATSSISVTVDNTPPVISAIASSTAQTTATVTWTTNEAATSQVVYGATSAYGSATSSASLITSHSIGVTGLTASTLYHYAVVSTDGQGNTATSSDQTFSTTALSFVLDFTQGSLPAGVTASGGANTTRVNASGNIVAATAPRFDYTWAGASRGLLVEPSRQNVLTHSEDLSNAAWSKSHVAATANAGASPDGGNHAANVYSTNSAFPEIYQHPNTGTQWTQTIYAKANGASWVIAALGSGAGIAWFNLSTCAVGTIGNAHYVAWVETVSNGFCRIGVTGDTTTSLGYVIWGPVDGDNTTTGTPSGTNGVLFWGAQAVPNEVPYSFPILGPPYGTPGIGPSSYIPATGSSAVTTTADVITFTVPAWVGVLKYTFDDGSVQSTLVPGGSTVTLTGNTQTNSANSASVVLRGTRIKRVDGSAPLPTFDYAVNFFPIYGQSLTVGNYGPYIESAQSYDNLMFTDGMRPQYEYPGDTDAQRYAGFVPAVEGPTPVSNYETPATAAGDMIKQLILSENGIAYTSQNYQMLLSTPGYGAQTILQLSKGGANNSYSRLASVQPTYGLSDATAASKTFAMQAVGLGQGENDYLSGTTRSAWAATAAALIKNVNDDVQLITGQPNPIPLIMYQVATHKVGGSSTPTIALAQTDLAASNPLAYVAMPMYLFPYHDDNNFHTTPIGTRWFGGYLGIAYKRIVIDKQNGVDHPKWQPLQPVSSSWSGSTLTVTMHVPVGNLVLDTTQVSMNTNYGFELFDSGGSPVAISSVSVSGNQVTIVAASNAAGGSLHYAWSGTDNSGTNGPRGNLRDQQGDTITFMIQGTPYRMDNWCVIFALAV